MNKNVFLETIRKSVNEIDKSAEVYLFGSRARENFSADSDWDFLILVENLTNELKNKIRHKLYAIEWETDTVISSIFFNKKDWASSLTKVTPLYKNILNEGVRI